MSAFYSICYDDRVELLTDGAVYTEDGTMVGTRRKVVALSAVPAAITVRGNSMDLLDRAGPIMDQLCAISGGFDGAMQALAARTDRIARRELPPFEMLIAGISESLGPVNYYLSNVCYMPNLEPFVLYRMPSEVGGGVRATPEELAQAGISVESVKDGLAERGADIMEIARRRKGPNPTRADLPEMYGIGGHVDLTVIRPGAVTTTTLRTWNDRVGERIDPFAADAEVEAA